MSVQNSICITKCMFKIQYIWGWVKTYEMVIFGGNKHPLLPAILQNTIRGPRFWPIESSFNATTKDENEHRNIVTRINDDTSNHHYTSSYIYVYIYIDIELYIYIYVSISLHLAPIVLHLGLITSYNPGPKRLQL